MISNLKISFSAADPFPLIEEKDYHYSSAQAHALLADQFFGFRISQIEAELAGKITDSFQKKEEWIGLAPSALQTPYLEIRMLLDLVSPRKGETVIDLGAGYGRMGLVIAKHYPETSFIGYERSRERVEEGNRIISAGDFSSAYASIRLVEQDLAAADFQLPEAEFYFLYDFGTLNSVKKILQSLKQVARSKKITVIGRGRRVRDEIERSERWLTEIVPATHHGNFSIYRSA